MYFFLHWFAYDIKDSNFVNNEFWILEKTKKKKYIIVDVIIFVVQGSILTQLKKKSNYWIEKWNHK